MELREVPRGPRRQRDRPLLADGPPRGAGSGRLDRESPRRLNGFSATPENQDWFAWHAAYDAPDSSLSKRLAIVQRDVRASLDACAPGPIRLVSMCAGQGHDVIGALEGHPRAPDVHARLVELDPANCAAARERAPENVEIRCADASQTDEYAGAVPAQIVLVNGVFGNISDAHIQHTIQLLPSLCAPGAVVTWTRHRRPPNVTPQIRAWFSDTGFEEVAYESPDGFIFAVGVNRLARTPDPFAPGVQMFEFLGSDQTWDRPE